MIQAKERGYPDMLVVDNGPELRGRELDRWAHDHGVKLFVIDPGAPMQNGSIESFNRRFREEGLDQSWFTSLAEATRQPHHQIVAHARPNIMFTICSLCQASHPPSSFLSLPDS